MPLNQNVYFTKAFFDKPLTVDTLEPSTELLTLYNNQPLYFQARTEESLREFRNTTDFQALANQYRLLISALEEWCTVNNASYFITASNSNEKKPAFQYLLSKIFRLPDDSLDLWQIIFFYEGKRSLENVLLLLQKEHLPVDYKKNILLTLQESLDECANGVFTNILDAKFELAISENLASILTDTKRSIIRQFACEKIGAKPESELTLEIHRVNALFNRVAIQYGLSPVEDSTARNPSLITFINFESFVANNMTPKLVMLNLAIKFDSLFNQFHQLLLNNLFNSTPSMGSTEFNTIKFPQLKKAIDDWNKKFGLMFSLQSHDLVEMSDDQQHITLLPVNHAFVTASVVKGFRKLFLNEGSFRYQVMIDDGSILYSDHDLLWVELNGKVLNEICFDPRNVITNSPADSCFLIDMILKQPTSNDTEKFINALPRLLPDDGLLVLTFVLHHLMHGFEHYLATNQITLAHLATVVPAGPCMGENTLTLLAKCSERKMIKLLLEKKLITQELLSVRANPKTGSNFNTPRLFIENKDFDLFEDCLTENLITSDMLRSIPSQHNSASNGFLSSLLQNNQFALFKRLVEKHLITRDLLNNTDVFWILTQNNQVDIMNHLLDLNLITPGQVQFQPTALIPIRCRLPNSLSNILRNKQLPIFHRLLSAHLITREQLLAGNEAITDNVLVSLGREKHIDILTILLTEQLITLSEAVSYATDEEMQERFKRIDKINTLFNKYNLTSGDRSQDVFARALRMASANNNPDDVQFILNIHPEIIDVQDVNPNSRKTPLHLATERGHCEVVSILIHAHANKEIPNACGKTASMMVCELSDEAKRCQMAVLYGVDISDASVLTPRV